MIITEEQFKKLPKWASQELIRLQREVDSLKEKLDCIAIDAETNTFIIDGIDSRPLPKNTQIKFKTGNHNANRVTVYVTRDGNIDVNTDSRLGQKMVIMPRAANSFYITFVNN
jgi:hypothetical protein